ncbi:MAG: preprotein translocase subunit SecG [Patescibacteria group bacterium]|nr:preprotein translocase subunit SecG [Patescibacteria group bacterium]
MIAQIQLILAILLIIAIVATQRGSDLSLTFGGTSEVYTQKRGAEKLLFRITIVLAIAFVGVSFWMMLS